MKHDKILKQLVAEAENDPNKIGFLLFGSLATGTHREDSDIDVISFLKPSKPAWGINNTMRDGIKVGDIFFSYDVMIHSVKTVPYLLHPVAEAKLLFDSEGKIEPMQETIRDYFADHPEMVDEWNGYYQQLKDEKAQYGYEKTTIVDVWNELEKKHSDGKTKRHFFNSFYLTSPRIFSIIKKFL